MKKKRTKANNKTTVQKNSSEIINFIKKVDEQLEIHRVIEMAIKKYFEKDQKRMLCEFCGDTKFSMKLNKRKKTFKCDCCGLSGGSVLYVMLYRKLSLREALQLIAENFQVDVSVIPRHVLIAQW